jgi:hypothetical protein
MRTGRPGTPGTNEGSVPWARSVTTPPASVPSIGTALATREPADRRSSSVATRRPSATPRPSVAATRAPSDTDPISALRSHRNSPSCATPMARASATTDTRTNSTTAAPSSAARPIMHGCLPGRLLDPGETLASRQSWVANGSGSARMLGRAYAGNSHAIAARLLATYLSDPVWRPYARSSKTLHLA